jgi:hypothetical protein
MLLGVEHTYSAEQDLRAKGEASEVVVGIGFFGMGRNIWTRTRWSPAHGSGTGLALVVVVLLLLLVPTYQPPAHLSPLS